MPTRCEKLRTSFMSVTPDEQGKPCQSGSSRLRGASGGCIVQHSSLRAQKSRNSPNDIENVEVETRTRRGKARAHAKKLVLIFWKFKVRTRLAGASGLSIGLLIVRPNQLAVLQGEYIHFARIVILAERREHVWSTKHVSLLKESTLPVD